MLFRALQINIQLRNVIQDTLTYQLPNNLLTSSPTNHPRQTLQASVVHRSSIDNGQPNRPAVPVPSNSLSSHVPSGVLNNITQTPRSPSNSDILEVMPLCPRPQNTSSHVTNVYQVKDFKSKEHNNNNQGEPSSDPRHLYSNDFNRDLAVLRNSLRQEFALNTIRDIEDEKKFLRTRFINDCVPTNRNNAPLSPTLSNASEHYAQLSIEQQEAARLYMNIVPSEANMADLNRNEVPSTPLTPKHQDYCNFGLGKLEINSYANLALGELVDSVNNAKQPVASTAEKTRNFSESDTFPSMSPTEELEVNYAVLDIDVNKGSAKSLIRELISPESPTDVSLAARRGRHLSQTSLEKSPAAPPANVGYTTIDFEKTVALTSVATGHMETETDPDASRKLRHNNSNATSGSPQ